MAWVRKAPNGKWRGCWRDHAGKERSETFATKTEALKFARKQEVEIDSGVRRDRDLGKWTVGEWMQEWIKTSPKHRAGTKYGLEGNYRLHVLPTPLAHIRLYKLAPVDIDRWVTNRVDAGVRPATIRQVHGKLSAVLNRAVKLNVIPNNPAKGIDIPEYQPRKKVTLREDEIVTLSEAVDPRYRALILVLGFGGIRVSEAAGLTPKDLDESQGYLWITRQLLRHANHGFSWGEPKTKNRKNTPSMISPFVVQAVRDHIDAGLTSSFQGETLIFSMAIPGRNRPGPGPGQPVTAVAINNMLHRVSARIGLPPAFRTHNLRDSCATNMLANGASVQDVADQIGDDPKTVLATYVHSSERSRREAISRMSTRALAGPGKVLELPAPDIIEGEVVEG